MKKNIVVAGILAGVMVMPTVVNANSAAKLQVASSFVKMGEEITAYQDVSINRFALNTLLNKMTMRANLNGETSEMDYVISGDNVRMSIKDDYSDMDMIIIGDTMYASEDGGEYEVIPFTDEESAIMVNSLNYNSEAVVKLAEGYTKEFTEDAGAFFFDLKETSLGSKKYTKDGVDFNTKIYKYTVTANQLNDLYADLLGDMSIYIDAVGTGASEVNYDTYQVGEIGQMYIDMYSYDFSSDDEYDMLVYLQDGVVSRLGFTYEDTYYDEKYDFDVYFLNKDNLIGDVSFVVKDSSVNEVYEMKLKTNVAGKEQRVENLDFYEIDSKTYAKTELLSIDVKSDYGTNAKDNVGIAVAFNGKNFDLKVTNNIIDNKYVLGTEIKNSVWEPILGSYVGDYSFWMEMYNSDEVIVAPVK